MCFAAEELTQSPTKKDSPKSESTPLYANEPTTPTKTDTTSSPTPKDPQTPPVSPSNVPTQEMNGASTPDGVKPSSPEPTTPSAANEKASINNVQTNNKNVEELYDIPVGKLF